MKILIASSLCPAAIEKLRTEHDVVCAVGASPAELDSLVVDREVIAFRSGVQITAEVMARAPDLKLLIRGGSGIDNLDVEYARQRSIRLVRVPGPGAQAVAELAFGLMIALAREIVVADDELRQGHWTKHCRHGVLLRGKVLGIVGAGNIGSRLGQMGTTWGMKAVGCVQHPSPAVAAKLRQQGIRMADFPEVLETADFLTLHVPLQDSTRKLIDAKALASMKPTAFLVNMARGGVVDEDALLNALEHHRRPAGAALDVHEQGGEGKLSPLAGLPNVIRTPHIGATTIDTQREIGERVIEIVRNFARGEASGNSESDFSCGNDTPVPAAGANSTQLKGHS